jgi:hypothetical protein
VTKDRGEKMQHFSYWNDKNPHQIDRVFLRRMFGLIKDRYKAIINQNNDTSGL